MKYLFTASISIVILIVVLIPGSNLPDVNPFIGFDKIVHIGLFGAWALAVYYEFRKPEFNLFLAFVVGISFSLFTEALQLFVEARSFDMYDLFADAAGLIIGLTISPYVLQMLKK
jgi:VanZ family protein